MCGEDINVGRNPKIGAFVNCDICDAQFEVADLTPILINWADNDDAHSSWEDEDDDHEADDDEKHFE